jgi:hypothetical protein
MRILFNTKNNTSNKNLYIIITYKSKAINMGEYLSTPKKDKDSVDGGNA